MILTKRTYIKTKGDIMEYEEANKIVERKFKHMEMTDENIQALTEFDQALAESLKTHKSINFIIDSANEKVYVQFFEDPLVCDYSYEEYVKSLIDLISNFMSTTYGEKDEEFIETATYMFNEVFPHLTYDYCEVAKDMVAEKTENMEMTKENILKLIAFEDEMLDIVGKGYGNLAIAYDFDDENQKILMHDEAWATYEGFVKNFWRSVAWELNSENFEKISEAFEKVELTYKNTKQKKGDVMNCENLVNEILNSDTIPLWEKRGIIGVGKSFEENRDHLNDILLDVTDDIWDEVLDEATKRYMESLPVEKTREDIIDEIVELCEEDTEYDMVEEVCEWLVDKSKYILQYFLYVGDIQQFVDEKIKRTRLGNVFLYCATEAEDTIIDLRTWAYYEKIGQGDNFSKEELEELYEKFVR